MPTPTVFVSYSHHDKQWTDAFVKRLRAGGWDVWYDALGFPATMPWLKKIEKELTRRSQFWLVLSPQAWGSDWVQHEIKLAIESGKPIVNVLHKPINMALFSQSDAGKWHVHDKGVSLGGAEAAEVIVSELGYTLPEAAHQVSELRAIALMSERLTALGYRAVTIGGVEAIIPPLRLIEAGPFVMGSDPKTDHPSYEDEAPQHTVDTDEYQIARFPVTVAEYACYLKAESKRMGSPVEALWRNVQAAGPDHPVKDVSWQEARNYAQWLARLTMQRWRLPSEVEWEKAARYDPATGQSMRYPWGRDYDSRRCNGRDAGNQGTVSVGSYPSGASPCGAEDMAGNVWEWTSTLYKRLPYAREDGRESLDAPGLRVRRGGAYNSDHMQLRAAHRLSSCGPEQRLDNGFRLALEE